MSFLLSGRNHKSSNIEQSNLQLSHFKRKDKMQGLMRSPGRQRRLLCKPDSLQDQQKGRRREKKEITYQQCFLMISTHTLWHVPTSSHIHTHTVKE